MHHRAATLANHSLLLAVLFGALAGCNPFDPAFDNVRCGAGGACPVGLSCDPRTDFCREMVDPLTDAAPPIDELPPVPRSGTIAVLDLTLTNPGLESSGATVSISYGDTSGGMPQPVVGSTQIGECAVWHHTSPDEELPSVDEGEVTIEGAGLRSPIGACSFMGGVYRCPQGSGGIVAGSTAVADPVEPVVSIQFLNDPAPFPGMDDVSGTFIEFTGFDDPAFNGRFPLVSRPTANLIVVLNPAATGNTTAMDGATYAVFAGEGPTPANRDFLGNDGDTITIRKEEGLTVPSFEDNYGPSGEGLVLDQDSDVAHGFPATAREMNFGCGAANCGPAGGIVTGFVLSGRTTNADLAGVGPTDLPVGTNYAVFRCTGQPGGVSVSMTQEAVEAVLATGPTRVQMQLLRVTADQAKPQTTVVVGHGFLGFTDIPQQ